VNALVRRFNELGARERIAGCSGLALVVVLFVAGALAGRDSRVALFAESLRSEQVSEVVDRLAAWNVPFVAGPDNVRVDANRRNELLLKLALAGVPHAHLDSSAEALAKAGPLTPQSVLDEQALDGLEGDLASGLRNLAGVEDAQVIVAPARDGGFAGETGDVATASVRLALRPGSSLTHDALAGVRQFVASAVPGLDAKRVAILDDRGIALGGEGDTSADDATALQQSLQSALDAALGAGTTVVRVRMSYDQRQREEHEIVRRPVASRAIGTTTLDERFKSSTKQYVKTSASEDRGSVVDDDRVDVPAGRLERISVAIAVDAARGIDLEKIRSLARATLGLLSSRGDQLTVEAVDFPREPEPAQHNLATIVVGLIGALGPALIAGVVLVATVRAGARPLGAACEAAIAKIALLRTARAVTAFAPAQVRGALRDEPPHTAAAIISALPAATATAVLELYAPEERAEIVRRMSRAAAPVVPGYEAIVRRG
jgi:flagellar biosynthesis/type III secretory pathway M-ring protein FliF/YscJ